MGFISLGNNILQSEFLQEEFQADSINYYGGRYWDRTSGLFDVNEALYH